MSSLVFDIGDKSRKVARFMGTVRRELQKAVDEEKKARKLTQQQLADMLDTSRSAINRQILGGNLTLRRLGELSWALGWEIEFKFRKATVVGQNQQAAPPSIAPLNLGRTLQNIPLTQTTSGVVTIGQKTFSATTSN